MSSKIEVAALINRIGDPRWALLGVVLAACTANNTLGPGGTAGASGIIGASGTFSGMMGVAGMAAPTQTGATAGTGSVKPAGTGGTTTMGTAGTTMMATAGMGGGMAGAGMAGSGMAGTGTSGAGGMGGGGTGGTMATGPKMPCLTKGNDLLLVGDSYIDTPVYLTPVLESDATMDMQLPAGQHYNMQAVAGTQSPQIKQQWDSNKSSMPKFVVMDGGGNDVLIGNPTCLSAPATDPTCDMVADTANATIHGMWVDMKASGVKGVVYFFYPHIPLASGGTVDYSLPKAKASCDAMNDATFKCVFVDTQPVLDNHPEYYGDGIHPSLSGGPQALAGVVWKAMKDKCIGQASGCCGG
jgi:hypothetical protein